MNRILTLDAGDYGPNLPELYRLAARGIIFLEGRLLLTENRYGEVKLPGGGVEAGEDEIAALIREVREETGYAVAPASIRPFGEIEEKRLSAEGDRIWHQVSRLYLCRVAGAPAPCSYSEGEKRLCFRPVLYTLEQAIQKNRAMLDREGEHTYNQREYKTLLLIRERLGQSPEGGGGKENVPGVRPHRDD